ncbi:MAG: peptidyl-tRNA hydrolase [Peptococcaceae bacterium BICA1-7]|nr:MAG: peptidyl-tRNA hydrolase [Peptococcaceae bacterium BICA1-7]HBV99270.1 aminoacyl-tRNA hydrolase [Desulfotomaculum sp.]
MHLVVGLGNPGREYARTRHNMGFMLVDMLAGKLGVAVEKPLFKSFTGRAPVPGSNMILAKPQTYMNLSGQSVAALLNWFKIPVANLIVVYDDLDLPPGKIRIRARGGHGGHRGMESIIGNLNSGDFPRIRVGIGRPENADYEVSDWVLGRLSEEEEKLSGEALKRASEAVIALVADGVEAAMNRFNRNA